MWKICSYPDSPTEQYGGVNDGPHGAVGQRNCGRRVRKAKSSPSLYDCCREFDILIGDAREVTGCEVGQEGLGSPQQVAIGKNRGAARI